MHDIVKMHDNPVLSWLWLM